MHPYSAYLYLDLCLHSVKLVFAVVAPGIDSYLTALDLLLCLVWFEPLKIRWKLVELMKPELDFSFDCPVYEER